MILISIIGVMCLILGTFISSKAETLKDLQVGTFLIIFGVQMLFVFLLFV